MDFSKLKVVTTVKREKSNSTSTYNTKKAIYKNGNFSVIVDYKEYPILIELDYISKVDIIYSKPENDKWDDWSTKDSSGKTTNLDISNLWWSCIKDGQRIKGKLEDGIFHLNLDYVNIVNKDNKTKEHNKMKKRNDKKNK